MLSNLDPGTVGAIGTLLVAHAGTLIKGYLSFRDRLVRIETKIDAIEHRHDKDIDALALKLGTERAVATAAARPS